MKIDIIKQIVKLLIRNKKVQKTQFVEEDFKTVCFFNTTAIGDTLFHTPIFRSFKQKFPKVKTIALLNPKNAKLFKDDPNLDEIIAYNGRWKSFFSVAKKLSKENIDIVFILHSNEPQATPLAVLSKAKYIFKLPNFKNEFNIYHSNLPVKFNDDKYCILDCYEKVSFVGIKNQDTRMMLYLNDEDFKEVDKILNKNGVIIGFQIGASVISKFWPLNRYIELAKMILMRSNAKIVLTGNKKELKIAKELEGEIKIFLEQNKEFGKFEDRLINLCAKFDIRQAAALIARVDVLITPDTGPLHIAAALKTPSVAIFGVTNPLVYNPNFDEDIHKFVSIYDGSKFARHKDSSHFMEKISAKEVYDKMQEILNQKKESNYERA